MLALSLGLGLGVVMDSGLAQEAPPAAPPRDKAVPVIAQGDKAVPAAAHGDQSVPVLAQGDTAVPAAARGEGGSLRDADAGGTTAAGADEVALVVDVILANRRDPFVDDRLKPIEAKLKKLFDFTHYVRLERVQATASLGKRVRLHLPEGHYLRLQPSQVDEAGRLRVGVELEEHFASAFRLAPGGTLLIGGPKLDRRGTMILALTAQWKAPPPAKP